MRSQSTNPRFLSVLAVILTALPLFLLIWIVLPAPFYILWLVALLAGEWSLLLGLVALVGAISGVVILRKNAPRSGIASIVCGLIAAGLSLYPAVSAFTTTTRTPVVFSATDYFFGSAPERLSPPRTFTYATPGGHPLKLDLYLPESTITTANSQSDRDRPAIVVVHGGSWNSGERSDFPDWNYWLASIGIVVVDIDYRLTPQPNWKQATEDVHSAVQWVKGHAAQFGIDPERVGLMGRSAGGQLALLAAYTGVGTPFRVQAVVALYAPTDLTWAYSHPANQNVIDGPAVLRDFIGGTPERLPEIYRSASPVSQITDDTPPTLLLHGGHDQLVRTENTIRLEKQLWKVQSPDCRSRSFIIPYAQHGFDYNYNGWGSQITRHIIVDFLRDNLYAEKR